VQFFLDFLPSFLILAFYVLLFLSIPVEDVSLLLVICCPSQATFLLRITNFDFNNAVLKLRVLSVAATQCRSSCHSMPAAVVGSECLASP
jgi:hypothetical protein